jgi:hypothetical protein
MAKTQITLETEMQRRARQRSRGVSRRVFSPSGRTGSCSSSDSRPRRPYFRSRKLGRLRCCKPKGFHDRRRFPIYARETATAPIALAMSLFVDTSIWYAAADSSDRSNARSKAILKSGETLVTSDHVLIETWICFASPQARPQSCRAILGRTAERDSSNRDSYVGGPGDCLGYWRILA